MMSLGCAAAAKLNAARAATARYRIRWFIFVSSETGCYYYGQKLRIKSELKKRCLSRYRWHERKADPSTKDDNRNPESE